MNITEKGNRHYRQTMADSINMNVRLASTLPLSSSVIVTAQEQSAIDGCDANSEGQKYVNKQEK
jgi:hypothetical protein